MATSPSPIAKSTTAALRSGAPARDFWQDDFPYIRKASITLGICLAIGGALAGASAWLLAHQKAALNQAQALHSQAQAQLTQAETEKREIRDFQPKYNQLLARGFIGEEKRLDWIERIQRIQQQRLLLPIAYQISPQQPFALDGIVPTGELELRGSTMQVTMDLLHEMDLINFLRDLRPHEPYVLTECTIRPAQSSQTPNTLTPSLSAACTIAWLTLGAIAEPATAEDQ